jgi:hypothetical protein
MDPIAAKWHDFYALKLGTLFIQRELVFYSPKRWAAEYNVTIKHE